MKLLSRTNLKGVFIIMNDLMKSTITTMEVADMMEISHNDILRKLDGRKDRKGYIQIMTEPKGCEGLFYSRRISRHKRKKK